MASTNKTPVFGLNQWDANDSVLREDFNADNLKTEAGLNAAMQAAQAAEQNAMQAAQAAEQNAMQAAQAAEQNAKAASVPISRTVNGKALSSNITLAKADVGLGNVDNTSDASKPVSTATQNALNLKANLASPALTGNPTAPTQAAGNNSTRIATTAFVTNAAAAASVMVKLTSVITNQATNAVTIDLSGFNLSQYRSLRVQIAAASATSGTNWLYMRINEDATNSYYYRDTGNLNQTHQQFYGAKLGVDNVGGSNGLIDISDGFSWVHMQLIYSIKDGGAIVWGNYQGCRLSGIQSLMFFHSNTSGTISVGSRFDIYGIK